MSDITLKPTTEEDLEFLCSLWNDGRVMKSVGFPNGVGETLESMQRWFARRRNQSGFHHFIIFDEDGTKSGEVCFGLDGSRAGLDIKLRPESQGRGLATKALTSVIAKAFAFSSECQLVWTEPSKDNQAARRLYTRCGMSEIERPGDMKGQGKPFWAITRCVFETQANEAEQGATPDAFGAGELQR